MSDQVQKIHLQAARVFDSLLRRNVATERGVHPETIVLTSARMTGLLLLHYLSSPSLSFGATDPSKTAQLELARLKDYVSNTLRQLGHSVDVSDVENANISSQLSRWSLADTKSRLEPEYLEYCRTAAISFKDAAIASAIATGLLIHTCREVLDIRKAIVLADRGVNEAVADAESASIEPETASLRLPVLPSLSPLQKPAQTANVAALESSFYSSNNSKLGKSRKWLWIGCLVVLLLSFAKSKGDMTSMIFISVFMLVIMIPVDWLLRRKLKTDQPQIILNGDAIESPLLSGKTKIIHWAEIVAASIKVNQSSPFLEFQLGNKPGRSDKRNFWTGINESKPRLLLNSFEAEDQRRIVEDINRCLQYSRAASGKTHTAIENPLVEEQQFQEQLKSFTPTPWVTYLLVAINVAVWFYMLMHGATFTNSPSDKLLIWGGNAASEVQKGEWWRLITSMFLHGGFSHLLMNMIGLVSIGVTVERIYGHRLFALIYFGSGVIGSALSLNYAAQHVVSVGASGAIFGIAGAMMIGLYQHKDKLPKTIGKQNISGIAVFILFNLVNGLASRGIDNAAHIGGLLGGCLLAYLLPEKFDMAHFARHLKNRAIVGMIVVMIATSGLAAIAPHATFDQGKAVATQQAFSRGMEGFLAAAKIVQQDQLSVKAGKMTELEIDAKSRAVYAPMYQKVLQDLSQAYLSPTDPRLPLLIDAKRMCELFIESFGMESVIGADGKLQPANPERMVAIELELKKLSAQFQQDVQNVKSKQSR